MSQSRFYLYFFLLIIIGCSDNQTSGQQTGIDTIKLFNPTGQSDDLGAEGMNIFKRNIALFGVDYIAILNNREYSFKSLSKVKEFVASNKEEIKRQLYYVIIDSATSFKKTISVINILKENDIDRYRVIDYVQYFTPAEPVSITTPSSVKSEKLISDPSWLFIEVLDVGYNAELNKDKKRLKDIKELDEFIKIHKSDIKDVSIRQLNDKSRDQLNSVIEVLKKYELMKFHLVTAPTQ